MNRAAPLALLLLLAAGPAGPAFAGDARVEQDFVAANELALKGDLAGAIALYRTLLEQGVEHEDLYFNLGNALAQSGKHVEAVLAYERALRLDPHDADTRENLQVVRGKLAAAPGAPKLAAEARDEHGSVVIADVLEPLVAPLPLSIFGSIAVAANLLLFASLFFARRTTQEGTRKLMRASSLISALALVLALVVIGAHYTVARDPRAVVTETVELKEGPHARFKITGQAGGGERVRVVDEDGGFVKILRRDGTSGWIAARSITRV